MQPNSTVLDIGVGTGAVALPLIELGHRVIGVDLSRPMLEVATGRVGTTLVEADASVLPVAGASVDAVLAIWAVHVVGDFDSLVSEVRRVLRPGGRWLIVSPTPDFEPVDVLDVAFRFGRALGRGWDRSEELAPRLARLGFAHMDETALDESRFSESPTERADSIEDRSWSSLWELDDDTWHEHIQPVVDDLRSLPEPHRPRDCVYRYALSVYEVTPR